MFSIPDRPGNDGDLSEYGQRKRRERQRDVSGSRKAGGSSFGEEERKDERERQRLGFLRFVRDCVYFFQQLCHPAHKFSEQGDEDGFRDCIGEYKENGGDEYKYG